MSLKSPKLSLAALGSRRLAPGEQGSLLSSRLYDVCPATNEDGHTAGSALEPGMQSGGEDQKTTKAELHDLITSCLGCCDYPSLLQRRCQVGWNMPVRVGEEPGPKETLGKNPIKPRAK